MERKQRRMKKDMIRRRVMAVFLCFTLALSFLVGVVGLSGSVSAAGGDDQYTSEDQLPNDAMHFIVRHWHTLEDDSYSKFQGTEGNAAGGVAGTDATNERIFIVQEGYIVPCTETSHNKSYHFYIVYQGNYVGEEGSHKKGDIELIDEYYIDNLKYIQELDFTNGTITFNIIPVTDEENEARNERFSGLSVSAGQGAVDTANKTGDDASNEFASFTIEYKSDIHLAKVHVFYIYEGISVPGSDNGTLFPTDGNDEQENKEVDTAYVYAYKDDATDGSYNKGDLVTDTAGSYITVGNEARLPSGTSAEDYDTVKIYSTLEGLHTDKTAYDLEHDGRTYDLELEAWYSGAIAANVGLVLDASGSMAFTSDPPSPINVLEALGIKRSGDHYVDKNGDTISSGTLLDLVNKIGALVPSQYWFPQHSKVIGYYPFDKVTMGGKTYVMDAGNISTGSYGSANVSARTYKYDDFFTIYWRDSDSSQSSVLADAHDFGNGYTSTNYISFGAKATTNRCTVTFTTEASTTVTVWWRPSGAGRQLAIYDKDPSSNDPIQTANVTNSTTNDYYVTSFKLSAAGTYYLGGQDKDENISFIYKVEVYVEPGTETKTHTLESKNLETFGNGTKQTGDTTVVDIFTIVWNSGSQVNDDSSRTWSDSYTSNKRINFYGASSSSNKRYITFETSGKATISVWWMCGANNGGRGMALWSGTDGTLAQGVTGSPNPDTQNATNTFITTWTVDTPGTYSIANDTGNNYIYKVVVSEEVVVEDDSFINSVDLTNKAPGATGEGVFVEQQNLDANGDFSFTTAYDGEDIIEAVVKEYGLNLSKLGEGIKLDAVPKGSFTISFSLTVPDNTPTPTQYGELLYIGPEDGGTDIFHAARRINSDRSGQLGMIGGTDGVNESGGTNVAGAFATTTKYITLVFTNTESNNFTVAPYLNGTYTSSAADGIKVTLDGNTIVLGGFADGYDGGDIYIDDVYVYDTALTTDEVRQLYTAITGQHSVDEESVQGGLPDGKSWSTDVFLTDAEVALLLNPHNTDNSVLSSSDYTYFVYDARSSTMEYVPLGYWEGGRTEEVTWVDGSGTLVYTGSGDNEKYFASGDNVAGAGWYYASYVSRWSELYDNSARQTAKSIRGIGSYTSSSVVYWPKFYDTITPWVNEASDGYGAAPDLETDSGTDYAAANSGACFDVEVDGNKQSSSVKFYIDSQGYLRCFFASNTSNWGVSYVYEKDDSDPVKTEALQRALGAFTTMLEESSPESMVSATRFSMDTNYHYYTWLRNIDKFKSDGSENSSYRDRFLHYNEVNNTPANDLDKLVLLDWTSNSGESANIMSLERGGSDGTQGYDTGDNEIKQYNYGMTGDTYTWVGLQSFLDNLAEVSSIKNNNDRKYLIIFTDGLDSEISRLMSNGNKDSGAMTLDAAINASYAKELADKLKNEYGYTIFSVMLTGGPVTYDPAHPAYDATDSASDTQFNRAQAFLLELSGAEGTSAENKENYFYVTDATYLNEHHQNTVGGDDDEGSADTTTTTSNKKVDMLIQIFAQDILGQIVESLNTYRVDDYIDPRFDLQAGIADATDANDIKTSKDEYVIRLNEGGKIQIVKTEDGVYGDMSKDKVYAEFDLTNGTSTIHIKADDFDWKLGGGSGNYYLTLNLSIRSAENARNPRLYYDSGNDMYYLRWRNQSIPGCTVGASKLSVWRARITVRAKDDFIGGNAILSNGQAASMNWVYYASDSDRSSGTGDMYKEDNDEYPSKGFPRTTLNVALLDLTMKSGEQILYLGEEITPAKLAEELSYTINYEYYWGDYLDRYVKLSGAKYNSVQDFFTDLMENETVMLPYYYLKSEYGNQAGNLNAQQSDQIGYLRYTWELIDPETELALDEGGYGTGLGPKLGSAYVTQDTRDVVYRLTVTYYPFPDPDDPLWDDWTELRADLATVSELSSKLSDVKAKLDALKAFEYQLIELAQREQLEEDEVDLAELKTELSDYLSNLRISLTQLTNHLSTLETAIEALQENDNLPADMIKTLEELEDQQEAMKNAAETLKNVTLDLTDVKELGELLTALNGLLENEALTAYEAKAETCFSLAAEYKRSYDYLLWCVGEDSTTHSSELATRDNENKDLIKETAYGPTSSGHYPKTAVGDPVYDKTVNGTYTTRIVRGELAFELDFDFTELQIAAGFWTDGRATFTLDVSRDEELDGFTTPIPDKLTITITQTDLEELENESFKLNADDRYVKTIYYKDELGEDTIYPKAIYTMDTGIVSFFSDPRQWDTLNASGYVMSIPYGDYTISIPDRTTDDTNAIWDYFTLGDLAYVDQKDYERDDHHFTDFDKETLEKLGDFADLTKYPSGANARDSVYFVPITYENISFATDGITLPGLGEIASNYYAVEVQDHDTKAQALSFGLGTTDTGTGYTYLTERVGMVKLTPHLKYLLPATGGEGTQGLMTAGTILIAAALGILVTERLLKQRRRRFEK